MIAVVPIDPDVDRELTRLDSRLARVEAIPTTMALAARDINEIRDDIAELKKKAQQDAVDKRTEFKWRIGTALVSAGLIISAMAVLLSVIGTGGHG